MLNAKRLEREIYVSTSRDKSLERLRLFLGTDEFWEYELDDAMIHSKRKLEGEWKFKFPEGIATE